MSEPSPHPSTLSADDLMRQCKVSASSRVKGPGGQHRNRNATGVCITHNSTGITGEANERRERQVNMKVALKRLRVNLAIKHRCPCPRRPSALFQSRVKDEKLVLNPGHDDFPSMLAEAMDRLSYNKNDLAITARQFQLSKSQLIKLLKIEPKAFASLNLKKPGGESSRPRFRL